MCCENVQLGVAHDVIFPNDPNYHDKMQTINEKVAHWLERHRGDGRIYSSSHNSQTDEYFIDDITDDVFRDENGVPYTDGAFALRNSKKP